MFILLVGIMCMMMGIMLYSVTYFMPIFRLVYLDWIALIVMIVPWFITLYRIKSTRCWYQVDRIPIWKHLIKYLRRDNEMIELIGERAYPGESFIDVKELGLIEFLGKDCFYSCGDKKFVWGLENINFTADPRYFNFTHMLHELGFCDSDDIKNVLLGNDLELMGKVYLNMVRWDGEHGVGKLLKELKEYDGDVVSFGDNVKQSKAVEVKPVMRHIETKEPVSVVKPVSEHDRISSFVDNLSKIPRIRFNSDKLKNRRIR